ncbi:MAG: tetratricopeptide repeat protein [Paeniclostridium sordellii]|uniref:Tetratricopeptide repeat protein n=1 Tax=Paeniclostridium hominis TaxID=2764329 RepID=A0ABR7K657_9FIRM|nr:MULTISPECIES: tetratricopeptide repeat protein [Paeniclostridium]MBC6004502.1 tetratricopeptide repeat protein [Paeniclostridium hominis]MDU1540213.1 tetratricopeptide repeat protein [Paeniclostridium sordellii]MDU2591401.1 tetratricopeptide repeat protein [Paeniclostridium sordellii]
MYSNPTYNEKFNLAKNFIDNKEFNKAYDLLSSISDKSSAKWFYLMGIASLNLGYYDQGEEYLKKAVSLSPENKEYEDALIRYNRYYDDYDRRARQYNRRRHSDLGGCCCCCCDDCCCCGDDFCEVCTQLWCLDTVCECFGGDFITCC